MPASQPEERVLIIAPLGQDAAVMAHMLRAEGISAQPCLDPSECATQIVQGAGALLMTEEALELLHIPVLLDCLKAQPAWSGLPLIVLTRGGENRVHSLLDLAASAAGTVTVLERPMSASTLLRSIQVALRSRRRQHQVRDLLEREKIREQRLRMATRAARLFAFEWDPITDAVRREGEDSLVLGVPFQEETGASYFARVHPDDRERFTNQVRSLRPESDTYSASYRVLRPDGGEAVVEESGRAFFDEQGRFVRLVGMAADITKRRQAEEALREAHQRLTLAKSAARLGIHEYRPLTNELIWDERMRELWGIEADIPISYDLFISRVHQDDREHTQSAVDRAMDPNGDGNYYAEYRLVHPNRNIWVAATGHVTFENGRAVRMIGMVQDITERREFQSELERLVTERTAKLNELVTELEHFSYSITHDMRAPLRSMAGFADMAIELCGSREVEEQKRVLQYIVRATGRMDQLITDALSYSEAVRKHLPMAPVDVGALVRGMLDTYPEFQAARAQIHLDPDIPLVFANEAGLTQCFSNLLYNAIKFSKPGEPPSIRIWAEPIQHAAVPAPDPFTAPAPISSAGFTAIPSQPAPRPGDTPHTHWVRIWVEDEGIGISPLMLSRVFNLFSRGSAGQVGTGIGLALVRKVVDRMGGRIGVESLEGKGTRFWIELCPATPANR